MSAVTALAEAGRAGIGLRLDHDGRIKVQGTPASVPADLLDRLRAHRRELVALLRGDACRECGAAIIWTAPGAVAFGDGTAAHLGCYEGRESARQVLGTLMSRRVRLSGEAGLTSSSDLPTDFGKNGDG